VPEPVGPEFPPSSSHSTNTESSGRPAGPCATPTLAPSEPFNVPIAIKHVPITRPPSWTTDTVAAGRPDHSRP